MEIYDKVKVYSENFIFSSRFMMKKMLFPQAPMDNRTEGFGETRINGMKATVK